MIMLRNLLVFFILIFISFGILACNSGSPSAIGGYGYLAFNESNVILLLGESKTVTLTHLGDYASPYKVNITLPIISGESNVASFIPNTFTLIDKTPYMLNIIAESIGTMTIIGSQALPGQPLKITVIPK